MKIRQFLKSLEYIKQETKNKHFEFYVKHDGSDGAAPIYLGKFDESSSIYDPDTDEEHSQSIIPINKNVVEFYTDDDYNFETIYDSVEQFKKVCQQFKISDNADIMLSIGSMDILEILDDLGISVDDREHEAGYFDISKITFNRNNNKVFLWLEKFDSNKLQSKQYEITYTVWEQNTYSVDIEAFSEEEAEAKFEEDNTNSTYPDKKDFEIVSVEEK